MEIPFTEYPANWDRDGKSAGYIRNHAMATSAKLDQCIIFPG